MSTAESLVVAALEVLERDGELQFSTRAVCALAKVTAPTLYHHFGTADALLSAAVLLAFEQFLAAKRQVPRSDDPIVTLAEGWDTYVRFALERPRLYSTMMSRVLLGAKIPAARQAQELLIDRIKAVASEGKLALGVPEAAQILWASANGAALLGATASHPDPVVLAALRDSAIRSICRAHPKEEVL